jgi:y4mF family transcriptional regulator
MFPLRNIMVHIRTPDELGNLIRSVRKALGLTQKQLALASHTNRRFVIEIEVGKPTAQIGKVLQVLRTLGVSVSLTSQPSADHSAQARTMAPATVDGGKKRHGPEA